MKNGVFWNVTLCRSSKNRRFRETYSLLMLKAISSFETSVLTRATWRYIPEDVTLQEGQHLKLFHTRLEKSSIIIIYFLSIPTNIQVYAAQKVGTGSRFEPRLEHFYVSWILHINVCQRNKVFPKVYNLLISRIMIWTRTEEKLMMMVFKWFISSWNMIRH
jgi:hypothetical protein